MYRLDENTEARSQTRALTTLRLSTYSHSHYSDEPNKEMHTILFALPHVTHTVNTRTNQTDTWLCLTYTLNHYTGTGSVPVTYKSKLHPCTDLTNTCTLQHKKTNKHKLNLRSHFAALVRVGVDYHSSAPSPLREEQQLFLHVDSGDKVGLTDQLFSVST